MTSVAPTGPTASVNITVVNSTVVGPNGTSVVNQTLVTTVLPTSTDSIVIVTITDPNAAPTDAGAAPGGSSPAAAGASSKPSGAMRAAATGFTALGVAIFAAALVIL